LQVERSLTKLVISMKYSSNEGLLVVKIPTKRES